MQPHYIPLRPPAKDITGRKFGRLIALGPVGKGNRGQYLWHCRCDCGNEVTITIGDLNSGHTQSCGCLKREMTSKRSYIHGRTRTRLYEVWKAIKARCFNSNGNAFKYYGGRGITLASEWINDFVAFADYVSALEHFEEKGYSLDRIDNDGNYEPGNLRWATRTEQLRNFRRNRFLTIENKTLTLAEWASISGIDPKLLHDRLKRGWSEFDAVFVPVQQRGNP